MAVVATMLAFEEQMGHIPHILRGERDEERREEDRRK